MMERGGRKEVCKKRVEEVGERGRETRDKGDHQRITEYDYEKVRCHNK